MPGTILSRLFPREEPANPLMPEKIEIIDHAFSSLSVKSFADLGGVWGVHAGYTFYALDNYPIESAFLIDMDFTREVKNKQKRYPQLHLIHGDFGSKAVVDLVPEVDAIFMFDILLHQVGPDWQDILRMYSEKTNCLVIYNPQYTGPSTVRLLDLGEEGYFANVPHGRDEEPYATMLSDLESINPQTGKPNRDYPGIWQWGIVDQDLTELLDSLGFEMAFYKNHGQWGQLKSIEGHSFVFQRV